MREPSTKRRWEKVPTEAMGLSGATENKMKPRTEEVNVNALVNILAEPVGDKQEVGKPAA